MQDHNTTLDATGLLKAAAAYAAQPLCRCGHHATDHSKEWSRAYPRYCLHYDDLTMTMCPCEGWEASHD